MKASEIFLFDRLLLIAGATADRAACEPEHTALESHFCYENDDVRPRIHQEGSGGAPVSQPSSYCLSLFPLCERLSRNPSEVLIQMRPLRAR